MTTRGHIEDSSTWSTNKNKKAKRKKSSQVKEAFAPFTMIGKFVPQTPVPKAVNFTMMKKFMLSTSALEMNVKVWSQNSFGGYLFNLLLIGTR